MAGPPSATTTMPRFAMMLTVLCLLLLCAATPACAFGAGEIPAYSAMSKTAYRHGTIEQVIETLAKVSSHGGGDAGAVLKGIAGALFSQDVGQLGNALKGAASSGGAHFSGLDVKRIYFGNWLRDYSQAVDVAGLSKLNVDSIVLLVMCLGFMAFGYATEEFEVTKEKLGTYLCTEHIDNPKGYPDNAQEYDSRLRPRVDDRELEIDERTGMKKYIASEGEGFFTSTECIRQHLQRCIELGRRGRQNEAERFEAYRELGTALHTLEDFLAHSNYLELALNKLGNRQVFCHVGDNVRIRAPNGQNVPPLVTGTFGSSDFILSLIGEAGDKLSSSTVDDLNSKFQNAQQQQQQGNDGGMGMLKSLLAKIPSGNKNAAGDVDSKLQNVEEIRKNAINIDPDSIASEEVQRIFVDVLRTRDSIFKSIEGILEQLGLDDLIEELSNALSVLVLTTIEPYVAPIIKSATEGLNAGSEHMLKGEDQTEVFTNPDCSDPTHSVLSKDHFDLWLNEPAGLAAIAVVKHTVPLVVDAWYDDSVDPNRVIDVILESMHHPYFASGSSSIQNEMLDIVRAWLGGLDAAKRNTVLGSLSKESVQAGRNKREEAESYGTLGHRCGGGGGAGHKHAAPAGSGTGAHGQYTQGSLAGQSQGRQNHQNVLATGNRITGNPVQQQGGYGRDDDDSNRYANSYEGQRQQVGTISGAMAGMAGRFGQQQQGHETGYGDRKDGDDGRRQGQIQSARYGRQHDDDDNEPRPSYGGQQQNRFDHDKDKDEHRDSADRYGQSRQGNRFGQDEVGYEHSGHRFGEAQGENSYGQPGGRYGANHGNEPGRRGGRYGQETNSYGRQDDLQGGRFGRQDDSENRYGQQHQPEDENRYGRQDEPAQTHYGRQEHGASAGQYGRQEQDEGRHGYVSGRGNDDRAGYGRQERQNEYGRHEQPSYGLGQREHEQSRYGGRSDDDNDNRERFGQGGMGSHHQQQKHFGGRNNDEDERRGGGRHGRNDYDEASNRFGQMNIGGRGGGEDDDGRGEHRRRGGNGRDYSQQENHKHKEKKKTKKDSGSDSDSSDDVGGSDSDGSRKSKENKHKRKEEKSRRKS